MVFNISIHAPHHLAHVLWACALHHLKSPYASAKEALLRSRIQTLHKDHGWWVDCLLDLNILELSWSIAYRLVETFRWEIMEAFSSIEGRFQIIYRITFKTWSIDRNTNSDLCSFIPLLSYDLIPPWPSGSLKNYSLGWSTVDLLTNSEMRRYIPNRQERI